ncbi:MAG: hypothetical protein ACYC7D_14910 [Nitrososphaerales archaeon]
MSRLLYSFRAVLYSGIAAASMGVGVSLLLNLNRTIILPFFPDVADALIIMLVGSLLLLEVLKDGTRQHDRFKV